jgi:hypothetical protein
MVEKSSRSRYGLAYLTKSPFSVGGFVCVSVEIVLLLIFVAVICVRHWHSLTAYYFVLLLAPVIVILLGQWVQSIRCFSTLRKLYSSCIGGEIKSDSEADYTIQIAAEGIFTILSYLSLSIIYMLLLIEVLLKRIDGWW